MLKPLAFITLGLCVIGLFLFLYQEDPGSSEVYKSGELLLEKLDTKNLSKIRIRGDGASIDLKQLQGGGWKEMSWDYEVDQQAVQDLLLELTEIRLGDLVTDKPDHHMRFRLLTPPSASADWDDSKHGVSLTLFSGEDTMMLDLLLGKTREQGLGQYMRYADMAEVFLLPDNIRVDTDINDWLEKSLLSVTESQVSNIHMLRGDGDSFILERDSSTSSWRLRDDNMTAPLKDKVQTITQRLEDLSFSRLLEPELSDIETGREQLATLTVTLVDGRIYTLTLGENETADGNYSIALRMSIHRQSRTP